jgi:Na+-transporting NADH:ubiquinone oxidoreductase subunit C
MQRNSALYTLVFTFVVCALCSVMVSGTYVALGEKQRSDAAIARMGRILVLAGLAADDEELDRNEIRERFSGIRPVAVDLSAGAVDPAVDVERFDQREATQDPATSRLAPDNEAGVRRLPEHAVVYEVRDDGGAVRQVLVPIHGQGYGGQIYGFLALAPDLNTVQDIMFYELQETPGLGARITRNAWRSKWPGRRIYDDSGEVALRLVSKPPPAEEAPYEVDAVSRATVTSTGVENMIRFWLGPDGFGPFFAEWRKELQSG